MYKLPGPKIIASASSIAFKASSRGLASSGSIKIRSMEVFCSIALTGIADSPSTILPFLNLAFSTILSNVTGITLPVTAKTELIF